MNLKLIQASRNLKMLKNCCIKPTLSIQPPTQAITVALE